MPDSFKSLVDSLRIEQLHYERADRTPNIVEMTKRLQNTDVPLRPETAHGYAEAISSWRESNVRLSRLQSLLRVLDGLREIVIERERTDTELAAEALDAAHEAYVVRYCSE